MSTEQRDEGMHINREQLAQEMYNGQHLLLMLILVHQHRIGFDGQWRLLLGFTRQECHEQIAALSDSQIMDLIARGAIPPPAEHGKEMPADDGVVAGPELFPGLEEALSAARVAIQPWQRTVQPGDRVVLEDPDSDLLIYGEIHDDPSCPSDMVFGHWCSVQCPSGESGDNHRSLIAMRFQGDEFARVAQAGWPESWEELLRLLWPSAQEG